MIKSVANMQGERQEVSSHLMFSTTLYVASWSACLWLSLFRVLLHPLPSLYR